jgi:hypothetical protein
MSGLAALLSLVLLFADEPRRIAAEAQPAVIAGEEPVRATDLPPPPRPAKPARAVVEPPAAAPLRCMSRGNRCRDLVLAGAVLAPLGVGTLAFGSVMFATGSEGGDRRPAGALLMLVGTGLAAIAAIVVASGVALQRRQRRAAMAAVRTPL